MSDAPPPTDQEMEWLRAHPPTDEQGRRIPWTLAGRRVDEVDWTLAVEHEALTLERVEVSATYWRGGVFRRCVFREVSFQRATLAQVRFEDVVFERCTFEASTLESCRLERCRFESCQMRFFTALRTQLLQCELTGAAVTVLDLRECTLSGTAFRDSSLQGLRATRVSADVLQLSGGELRGGDLTLCEFDTLRLSAVRVEGLRVMDGKMTTAAFSGACVSGLDMSGTKLETLSLSDCPEILALRVLSCQLTELRIEACPSVMSPLVSDSSLERFLAREATFFDGAFERVAAGQGSRIEGGEFAGVFFNEGRWGSLDLVGTRLNGYVAVTGTFFRWLRLGNVQASPDELDLRLRGDMYGPGSLSWRDIRGSRTL